MYNYFLFIVRRLKYCFRIRAFFFSLFTFIIILFSFKITIPLIYLLAITIEHRFRICTRAKTHSRARSTAFLYDNPKKMTIHICPAVYNNPLYIYLYKKNVMFLIED